MNSRRDQLQAHLFVVGRMVSALVRSEPDAQESPQHRSTVGLYTGALVATLAVIGFGVMGLISPGASKSWQEAGALILEKESGSRFIFVDNQLHPILNIASARLILGSDAKLVSVSAASLQGVARGRPLGIPAAPDALPEPARLVSGAWLVCSAALPDAANVRGPVVTLEAGVADPGKTLPDAEGIIVKTPDDQAYLIWHDRRFRIATRAALVGLGYGAVEPLPVGFAWINAVPAARDLGRVDVANHGQPGPAVGGSPRQVGQVFVTSDPGGARSYFVLQSGGLAALTATEAALLLADPETKRAYLEQPIAAIPATAAELAEVPQTRRSPTAAELPALPPRAAQGDATRSMPCVESTPNQAGAKVRLLFRPAPTSAGTPDRAAKPAAQADDITIPPGKGVLAQRLPGPGVTTGALYLITDDGVKYPLPSTEVATQLGYPDSTPTPISSALLDLLPTGPALDPAIAKGSGATAEPTQTP